MKRILIIGATSAIAEATAQLFAQRHDKLYLLARNGERLQSLVSDLKVRGAETVFSAPFDAHQLDTYEALLQQVIHSLGGLDLVLIAHGTLPDQKACEQSMRRTYDELMTNEISTIALLTFLGNYFEAQKSGVIAVISSVAGDRGRQSNYIYGAAKGAISIFLQGLRNRLQPAGVQVLTIKPGFVDTPMTAAFKKGALWAQPQSIAKGIVRAIEQRRDVAYLPGFWYWIMLIIRTIPEPLFKRAKL